MEFKACTQACGEIGHTASSCNHTCSCGGDTHMPNECPMKKVACFLCEGTYHVRKDCQLNLVLVKTKEERRKTMKPNRQPMTVNNKDRNFSALPPTPTLEEANSGSSNIVNDVHRSLFLHMHTQKHAPRDQPRLICFNCLEPGNHINKCPFPRPKKLVRRCFNYGKAGHLYDGCPVPKRQYLQVDRHCLQHPSPSNYLSPDTEWSDSAKGHQEN